MESGFSIGDSPLSDRSLAILDEADYALQQSRLAEFREAYLSVTDLSEAQSYHAQISGLDAALKRHDEVSFGILQEVTSHASMASAIWGSFCCSCPGSLVNGLTWAGQSPAPVQYLKLTPKFLSG